MIPVEQLSTIKTNVIEFRISKGGGVVGQVVKIIEECGKDQFKCLIDIYPGKELEVITAMEEEKRKLLGGI